ncbi:MAG: hypothetical protein ACI4AD_11325 [Roseburia sp.]
MDINAVNNQTTAYQTTESVKKSAETTQSTSSTTNSTTDTGVIYEKSSATSTDKVTTKTTNSALVAKLKADAEERTSQLRSLVEKMMTKQGTAIGTADSMWSFLAKGKFEDEDGNSLLTAADIAQAKADIAEDGYWGVEQTSDRILDFAKALSGDDPDKADLLLNAFKKGFEQATKSWGDKLPDISQRTYDAVVEKFNNWKNGTETAIDPTQE